MKSTWTVLKEQFVNLYLIRRLSIFELKSDNSSHYLGVAWEVINPMIQIAIYWFFFGVEIRRGAIEHVPYIYWMLSGIVAWFFINQATLQATRSIYSRIRMVAKMSFPLSVVPTYVIVAKLYQHFILAAIVFIILQFTPYHVSWQIVQLPYFMFATLAVVVAFSLITSTLAAVVRDVQMIVQSLMRVLIYFSPVLWSPDRLPSTIQFVMRLNPLYYVIEGYRATLLGTSWYITAHYKYTIYFWVVVFLMFMVGSALHVKFRDRFIDYV